MPKPLAHLGAEVAGGASGAGGGGCRCVVVDSVNGAILDLVLEVPSLTSLTVSPNRRNTQDFS